MSDYLDFSFNQSQENIFGGHDFFDAGGQQVAYSSENIFGGHDIHGRNHEVMAQTTPNIFGGTDVNHGTTGQTLSHTENSAHGISSFDSNGHLNGTGSQTNYGGEFVDLQGVHTSWQNNIFGGVSADPFSQLNTLTFPPLI